MLYQLSYTGMVCQVEGDDHLTLMQGCVPP